ncbi:MAG: hypothetical protein IT436_03780 [Phycisphaerales bacterium]|nr:hypothetical protein [Phycisphaerales bacterium]
MIVAVSPYHLTTREPPAMAGLLLGEEVVTMLPAPLAGGGAAAALEAASRSPRYRKFVESWQWLMPLWKAGVLSSRVAGEDIGEDVRRACDRIDRDGSLTGLRPFMRPGLFDDEKTYLDAVAGDVLKGGPDPGICVPVSAGLDRFAARHELMVMRAHPTSVAQQAEARMGVRLFAIGIPALVQAGGGQLLEVRERLGEQIFALRRAITAIARGAGPRPDRSRTAAELQSDLNDAARAYSARFEAQRDHLLRGQEGEPRVIDATVTVLGVRLPVDSVLRSSATAARVMVGAPSQRGAETREESALPAVWDPGDGGSVVALIVKRLGAAQTRRR